MLAQRISQWEGFPAQSPDVPDQELAEHFARYFDEDLLPAALGQTDPLLVFADLGTCIQALTKIHGEEISPASFMRKFGSPEWTNVSIDRQNLADRVSEAFRRNLKSGDQFCDGHDFPGKEKDLVIESRHPQARGAESRTQTRAVFNTFVLIEHLKKIIATFLTRLKSPAREAAWIDAIRNLRAAG